MRITRPAARVVHVWVLLAAMVQWSPSVLAQRRVLLPAPADGSAIPCSCNSSIPRGERTSSGTPSVYETYKVQREGDAIFYAFEQGLRLRFADPPDRGPHAICVSPDGTRVAYVFTRGDQDLLYVSTLSGSETRLVARLSRHGGCLCYESELQWDPDGAHLVFRQDVPTGNASGTAWVVTCYCVDVVRRKARIIARQEIPRSPRRRFVTKPVPHESIPGTSVEYLVELPNEAPYPPPPIPIGQRARASRSRPVRSCDFSSFTSSKEDGYLVLGRVLYERWILASDERPGLRVRLEPSSGPRDLPRGPCYLIFRARYLPTGWSKGTTTVNQSEVVYGIDVATGITFKVSEKRETRNVPAVDEGGALAAGQTWADEPSRGIGFMTDEDGGLLTSYCSAVFVDGPLVLDDAGGFEASGIHQVTSGGGPWLPEPVRVFGQFVGDRLILTTEFANKDKSRGRTGASTVVLTFGLHGRDERCG